MFKNTFQSKLFTILFSVGSRPLLLWEQRARNGHIERVTDHDIRSQVIEVEGLNVSTTFIACPADPKQDLGIKLPFLVMIIKSLKKNFTFEVEVLDDKNLRRRFRASTYHSSTQVNPFSCTMPIKLDKGWNIIQTNLLDITSRAYGTNFIEALRVQVHANCRIRRVYFSDKLYSQDELPAEYKVHEPLQQGSLSKAGPGSGKSGAGSAKSGKGSGKSGAKASGAEGARGAEGDGATERLSIPTA